MGLFWGGSLLGMLSVPQGAFPRGDTAEDGYHGVSPVTAFPAQNSYGTEHPPPALGMASASSINVNYPLLELGHSSRCVGSGVD